MIGNKEMPVEYVSIRQVWLQNINRCCEAMGNRAKPDASHEGNWQEVGARTVYHSVKSLYYSLVDYGEAKVKTDCDRIRKEFVSPQLKDNRSVDKCADIYQLFFEKMIQVLNRYGMLFDSQPQGYTNVEMKSV